jgi:hypothetical protein
MVKSAVLPGIVCSMLTDLDAEAVSKMLSINYSFIPYDTAYWRLHKICYSNKVPGSLSKILVTIDQTTRRHMLEGYSLNNDYHKKF